MTNRELVLSYLASFSSGDPDAVAGHVSDDFENIQVGVLGTGCTGKLVYRDRLQGFLAAFANLQYQVDELIVEGDNVAATYTMTFRQDGRDFNIPGVMIITVSDGSIGVRRDYWDGLEFKRQAEAC